MRKQPIELPHSCPGKPTVSVIVPTYNHEDYINECIDGILMQEDCEYEAIIIEDESSDRTREICIARQKERPDRLRLILNHRENNIYQDGRPSGIFSVLHALDVSRGKYIGFCEGDDFWCDTKKLYLQTSSLEGNPQAVLSCHGVELVDADGKHLPSITNHPLRWEKKAAQLRSGIKAHISACLVRNSPTPLPPMFTRTRNFDNLFFRFLGHHGECMFDGRIKPGKVRRHMSSSWQNLTEHQKALSRANTSILAFEMHRSLGAESKTLRTAAVQALGHQLDIIRISRYKFMPTHNLLRTLASTFYRLGPMDGSRILAKLVIKRYFS